MSGMDKIREVINDIIASVEPEYTFLFSSFTYFCLIEKSFFHLSISQYVSMSQCAVVIYPINFCFFVHVILYYKSVYNGKRKTPYIPIAKARGITAHVGNLYENWLKESRVI